MKYYEKYPTQGEIKEVWEYKKGQLWWKERGRGRRMNRPVGSVCTTGYRRVGTGRFLEHAIIYIYHYGKIPKGLEIDHIDGDKLNNKIINLRSVTKKENHMNRKTAKGYCFHKKNRKWLAMLRVDGELMNLGSFSTTVKARQAYLNAKAKYHIIKDRKPCV
jgi:hypothetical protein